jgi:hypothetical protein
VFSRVYSKNGGGMNKPLNKLAKDIIDIVEKETIDEYE